jgi:hypothetical protein
MYFKLHEIYYIELLLLSVIQRKIYILWSGILKTLLYGIVIY